MKLIFLKPKKEKNRALIGRTGVIRFNKEFAKTYNFKKREHWIFGIDEEEKPVKNIYLFKAKNDEIGYKMNLIGESWSLDGHSIVENTKIEVPIKCNVAPIKINGYEGFVLSMQ